MNEDYVASPSGLAPGKLTRSQALPVANSMNSARQADWREPFGSRIGQPSGAPLQAKGSKDGAPTATKSAPQASPQPNLDEVSGAIGAAYQFLFERQADGIATLKEKAAASDEKEGDFFLSFLEVAAALAVAAGIGMVDELVSQSIGPGWVASRTPDSAKDNAALREKTIVGEESKIAAAGMKQAAKSLAKSLVKGSFDAETALSADQRFFRAQSKALIDLAMRQQQDYHLKVRPVIRVAADPLTDASVLREAVVSAQKQAGDVQQRETMKAWALAKAKASEGTVKKLSADGKSQKSLGTDLGKATNKGAGSDGVLDLVVGWDQIPNLVGVESAKMDGFNAAARALLVGQSIESLGVPVVLRVNSSGCRFTIGVSETGEIWLKNVNPRGVKALSRLSGKAGARQLEGAQAFGIWSKSFTSRKLRTGRVSNGDFCSDSRFLVWGCGAISGLSASS